MQRKSDRHLDVLSTILHPYASTGFDRISRRVSQEQSDWKKLDIYTIWTYRVHNFVTGIVDQLFVNVDFFFVKLRIKEKFDRCTYHDFFFLQSDNIYHGMDGLLFIVLLTSSIFLSLLCVLLYCILFLLNKYYFVQHYIIVVCN